MTREGEAGQAGTKFGAKLDVLGPDGKISTTPKMVLGGGGGPSKETAPIDGVFGVEMEGMDAADKSVKLVLSYKMPIFPIELYYKPMTILVWLGVGILAVGGFLSAWDRRRRPRKSLDLAEPMIEETAEKHDDALVSVP
jgi:cytochrome c-type biogenesis protein CcmF